MTLKLVTCTMLLKALCRATRWPEPPNHLCWASVSHIFLEPKVKGLKVKTIHIFPSSLLGQSYLPIWECFVFVVLSISQEQAISLDKQHWTRYDWSQLGEKARKIGDIHLASLLEIPLGNWKAFLEGNVCNLSVIDQMKLCRSYLMSILIPDTSIICMEYACMYALRLQMAAECIFKAKSKAFQSRLKDLTNSSQIMAISLVKWNQNKVQNYVSYFGAKVGEAGGGLEVQIFSYSRFLNWESLFHII